MYDNAQTAPEYAINFAFYAVGSINAVQAIATRFLLQPVAAKSVQMARSGLRQRMLDWQFRQSCLT